MTYCVGILLNEGTFVNFGFAHQCRSGSNRLLYQNPFIYLVGTTAHDPPFLKGIWQRRNRW